MRLYLRYMLRIRRKQGNAFHTERKMKERQCSVFEQSQKNLPSILQDREGHADGRKANRG